MQTPGRFTGTAIVQIVSGAVNLLVMWWLAGGIIGLGCGTVSGIVSLGICPIGTVCGFVPWLLLPLGVFEIIGGILGLASPKSSGSLLRIVSILEMVSLLFGGVGSFVAGAVGLGLMADPEVKAFLENRS